MILTLKMTKQKRMFIGGKYVQNLDKSVMLLDALLLQFGLDP